MTQLRVDVTQLLCAQWLLNSTSCRCNYCPIIDAFAVCVRHSSAAPRQLTQNWGWSAPLHLKMNLTYVHCSMFSLLLITLFEKHLTLIIYSPVCVSSMFLLNVVSSWLFLLCMFLNVCVLFQEIVSVRCFAVVWLGYTSQLVLRKIICVLCNDPSVDFSCFWRGIKSDVVANIDTDRCLLKRPPVFN